MFGELKSAVKDVFSKKIRGLLFLTAFLTLLVFILLFWGFSFCMAHIELSESPVLEKSIEIFGYIAFFIMALMLFPAVATFVSGFLIDSVIDRTAPHSKSGALRDVSLSESLNISASVAVKGVVLSVLLIPVTVMLGLIPFVNLVPVVLYYGLNGRLLAREYFFAVALRYTNLGQANEIFNHFHNYWIKAGIIIAVLMTIPVVNIISPLIAMAFMQRLFLKKQKEEA